jgi:hypothetical protein
LSLLRTEEVRSRLGEDSNEETAAVLLYTVAVLGRQAPILGGMMSDHQTIAALLSVEPTDDDEVERCHKHMSPKLQALRTRIDSVVWALERAPYPY